MKKALILATLVSLSPLVAEAAGLELYSYRDRQGQLVVVDSLERIPEEYRNKAERNFIPSFKSPAPTSIDTSAVEKVKLSRENEGKMDVGEQKVIVLEDGTKDSDLDVVEAPEEIEPPDPGLDRANEIIQALTTIQNNNKNIYNSVLSTKLFAPVVKNLQTRNVATLSQLKNPQYIDWKRKHPQKKEWGNQAAQLIERFKTIQFTVTKWFGESPGNLLHAFPAYISASDGHLRELNDGYNALKELDAKMIEEESKTKKKKTRND